MIISSMHLLQSTARLTSTANASHLSLLAPTRARVHTINIYYSKCPSTRQNIPHMCPPAPLLQSINKIKSCQFVHTMICASNDKMKCKTWLFALNIVEANYHACTSAYQPTARSCVRYVSIETPSHWLSDFPMHWRLRTKIERNRSVSVYTYIEAFPYTPTQRFRIHRHMYNAIETCTPKCTSDAAVLLELH